MLEYGADANANRGESLTVAAKKSNLEMAKLLIKYGGKSAPNDVDALIHAVREDNLEMVKLLLESEAVKGNLDNALKYAFVSSDSGVMQYLVSRGAKL